MKLTAAGLVAFGIVACSAIGITAVGTGIARGAPSASPAPATFQMYANVDAEGDLGSHYDATSARAFNGAYIVTFTKPIGHCAIVAQSGKAGGSDTPQPDPSTVLPNNIGANPDPVHQVLVGFTGSDGFADSTPFMLVLTCKD